ncbi:hypothetical protein [Brevibacillus daliensis]|uniref:hypothetical protein n=1 Tax=Brevibacillus daliensis TaxID=2892995 RepID=UPI001E337F32|nr:hypothetical protein [Brevibacillus daliensis]
MLNLFLLAIENLALTIIFGGGIIMAAGVRPLLIEKLSMRSDPKLVSAIEEISINAWNRYNRFAFIAALLVTIVDLVRLISGLSFEYWHICLNILIVLAFIRKFAIDKQLKNRLNISGATVVGSKEQNDGHRQVEFLSKAILIFSLLLIVLPI